MWKWEGVLPHWWIKVTNQMNLLEISLCLWNVPIVTKRGEGKQNRLSPKTSLCIIRNIKHHASQVILCNIYACTTHLRSFGICPTNSSSSFKPMQPQQAAQNQTFLNDRSPHFHGKKNPNAIPLREMIKMSTPKGVPCVTFLSVYIGFFFKVLFSFTLSFTVKELKRKGKQSKPGVRAGAVEQEKSQVSRVTSDSWSQAHSGPDWLSWAQVLMFAICFCSFVSFFQSSHQKIYAPARGYSLLKKDGGKKKLGGI